MEFLLAAVLFLRPALAHSQLATTSTTLLPVCLDDADCDDDGDNCTDEVCDDDGECQHPPVPVDEQASCVIDNIRDIESEPPALACAGACRCASLGPLLDRADGLIEASLDANTVAGCRHLLHAVRRTARRLRRRVNRLATLGCLAPVDRTTRIDDQLTNLIQRVPGLVAQGYCSF